MISVVWNAREANLEFALTIVERLSQNDRSQNCRSSLFNFYKCRSFCITDKQRIVMEDTIRNNTRCNLFACFSILEFSPISRSQSVSRRSMAKGKPCITLNASSFRGLIYRIHYIQCSYTCIYTCMYINSVHYTECEKMLKIYGFSKIYWTAGARTRWWNVNSEKYWCWNIQ